MSSPSLKTSSTSGSGRSAYETNLEAVDVARGRGGDHVRSRDGVQDERISFVCQRCLQPLRIDPSFYAMNEHTAAEIKLPIATALPLESRGMQIVLLTDDQLPQSDNSAIVDNEAKVDLVVPSVDFTLVDEAGGETPALSSRLKAAVELFDLISNSGEVDHPLCEECTDTMLDTMDHQLKLAEEDAQEYQEYLRKLNEEKEDESQVEELQKELEALELEEKTLLEDLQRLKAEEKSAEEDLARQMKICNELESEEDKYWREYSKYKRDLLMAEDDFKSLECRLNYTQSHLEKLKKMNVFNLTFHIWHVGHFATINGFRLGRLPSVPVEWSEINAAWGHTAFLLHSLAKAIGMKPFQRYQLVPFGNFSYVKVLADDKILPLYGTGGFRRIFDSKFDSAMVAFLDCLQQFAAEVEAQGGFSLPYPMEKGKIRDNNTGQFYSIKLQFNSEDSWTKALRYMLTNLKWGLAFVSTSYLKSENPEQD